MNETTSAFLCATLASVAVIAASQQARASEAILIGGGSNMHRSQAQMELNVKWVQEVLNEQMVPTTVYFTDGNASGADVHFHHPMEQATGTNDQLSMEAISRVFGDNLLEGQHFREHTIDTVSGSTRLQELEPALRSILSKKDNKEVLMVFNGNGSRSGKQPENSAIKLWDDSELTAAQLHTILNTSQSPVRYVFSQCYSGGFHRIAYKNPSQGLELGEVRHCGFTSESAYRQTDYCSASANTNDHLDYSSYFFSALHGYERDGEIISRFADTNENGVVSLREAHLFTLREAFTVDLPRSTSEDFLMRWQPWYLRWMPNSKLLPNNEYARLFRDIAVSYNIDLNNDVANTIRKKMDSHESEILQLQQQMTETQGSVAQIRSRMQLAVSAKWPEILSPYTSKFSNLASSGGLQKVSSYIRESMEEYEQLVDLQSLIVEQEKQLQQLQRQMTLYTKLLQLRRLAYLKKQLSDYGSSDEKASYQSLLQCESEPLTPTSILTTDTMQ